MADSPYEPGEVISEVSTPPGEPMDFIPAGVVGYTLWDLPRP
ncbi:hypothetical protein [Microbacterium sp. Leaf320]|nr:hypothetical protein [Microbacterium sp. Leaf320]